MQDLFVKRKKIKLGYCGFWKSFNTQNNLFTNILKKYFEVEIVDIKANEKPDFLIASPLGEVYEYMKFDCPRIMYTGEFLAPDFSAFDYFIGYDYCDFSDRYLRYPLHLWSNDGCLKVRKALTEDEAYNHLKNKKYFCNFIYGHQTQLNQREILFKKLSEYKTVTSSGKFMNNMPDGKIVGTGEKYKIVQDSKFTIAAESVHYPGFTSEKIDHAFRDYSIPIYWGDPCVSKEFNTEAFIDCETVGGIDKAIEKVIEIDNNDEMYVHMLCQYQFAVNNYEILQYEKLEKFLISIFSQEPEEAYRRPRYYRAGWHEKYLKEYNHMINSFPYRMLRKLGI